jgi:hypothetical protein
MRLSNGIMASRLAEHLGPIQMARTVKICLSRRAAYRRDLWLMAVSKERRSGEMRVNVLNLLRTVARCVDRLLAVHLRMDLVSGLRTR